MKMCKCIQCRFHFHLSSNKQYFTVPQRATEINMVIIQYTYQYFLLFCFSIIYILQLIFLIRFYLYIFYIKNELLN